MPETSKKQKKRERIRALLKEIYYFDLPKNKRPSQKALSEELNVSVGMINLVCQELMAERKRKEQIEHSKKAVKSSISEETPIPRTKKQIISHTDDSYVEDRIQQLEPLVNNLLARQKTIPSLPEFEAWLKTHTNIPEGASLYRRISGEGTKHGERKAAGEVRKTLDMLRMFFNE